MDFKREFVTNKKLEDEGRWFDLKLGARIKLSRYGNKNARKFREMLLKPYASQKIRGELPDEVEDEITRKVLANCVIQGWENIEIDGEAVEYSPEKALELLEMSEDFGVMVLRLSGQMENYLDANYLEEAEKN